MRARELARDAGTHAAESLRKKNTRRSSTAAAAPPHWDTGADLPCARKHQKMGNRRDEDPIFHATASVFRLSTMAAAVAAGVEVVRDGDAPSPSNNAFPAKGEQQLAGCGMRVPRNSKDAGRWGKQKAGNL